MLATILFLAAVRLLSPTEDATVELQKPVQRAFFALPREARLAADADQVWRDRQVACGWRPLPVRFAWAGATNEAHVTVRRLPDGAVFFAGRVNTNEIELSNLEIAREYAWEVASDGQSATGRFRTAAAAPRFLSVGRVINTRDFGGRLGKDGRRVRQGVILRSGQFNATATCRAYSLDELFELYRTGKFESTFPSQKTKVRNAVREQMQLFAKGEKRLVRHAERYFVDKGSYAPASLDMDASARDFYRGQMKVRTELDLRSKYEAFAQTASPLGPDVRYFHVPGVQYAELVTDEGRAAFREELKVALDPANYPLAVHCVVGADRTGSLLYVLGSLLGVSADELWQDWEATHFWYPNAKVNSKTRLRALPTALKKAYPGVDEPEAVRRYVLSLGFTESDIVRFQEALLEPAKAALGASATEAVKR